MPSRSWQGRTAPGSTARRCEPMAGSSDPARSGFPRDRCTSSHAQQGTSVMPSPSSQVILVTGASSGFGLMTAKALAQAGHIVYASMRETEGRNAPQVAAAAQWASAEGVDLRTIELDVQSDPSAEAGVARIISEA